MKRLYPEIEPFAVHALKVGTLHTLHVEESGSPEGIPVVFLHGGPGSGCKPYHRSFFDPQIYRAIVFDQRGCSRSAPQGETRENTTHDLIDDLETIRTTLGIDRWLLFGGSWGATLTLLYAETHPQRVSGIIVRGSFLARSSDLEWFISGGASRIFPDYWDEFVSHIPEGERDDLVKAYYLRAHSGDKDIAMAAAKRWSDWAGRVVTWLLSASGSGSPGDSQRMLNEVLIETHYASNRYFLDDNQLLRDANKIPAVPVTVIHGRRDLTCTLEASWQLHRALPESQLIILRESGHLAGDSGMIDALVRATDEMASQLR